jgi:hypothetical protein
MADENCGTNISPKLLYRSVNGCENSRPVDKINNEIFSANLFFII